MVGALALIIVLMVLALPVSIIFVVWKLRKGREEERKRLAQISYELADISKELKEKGDKAE